MLDYIQKLIEISEQENSYSVDILEQHLRRMSLFPHIFASLIDSERDKEEALRFIHNLSLKANKEEIHICFVLAKVAALMEQHTQTALIPEVVQRHELEFSAALQYIVTGAPALEEGITQEQKLYANEIVVRVLKSRLEKALPII